MAIATETTKLHTFAFFLPLGLAFTVPSAGAVGVAAKPDAADPVWAANSLGDIEEFTLTPKVETYEKKAWRAGGMVMADEIELSRELNLKWKTQDLTPLCHRLAFGTLDLTGASSQANPLEGELIAKGWLKIQAYAGPNRRVTGDLWVSLRASAVDPWSGKNIVQVEIEAKTLHSTLNTLKFE